MSHWHADPILYIRTYFPRLQVRATGTTGANGRSYPADQMLPSCSTCQLYLKLPAYSSKAVLRTKLLTAIREGQEVFAFD